MYSGSVSQETGAQEVSPRTGRILVDTQQGCRFLGLRGDATTRARRPLEAHRCLRDRFQHQPTEAHQAAYCLTSAHAACPAFAGGWAQVPSSARREIVVLPLARRITGVRPRLPHRPALLLGLGGLALALTGGAFIALSTQF